MKCLRACNKTLRVASKPRACCLRPGVLLQPLIVVFAVTAFAASSLTAQPPDPFRQFFGPQPGDKQRIERVPISVRQEQQIGEQQFRAFTRKLKAKKISLLTRGGDHRYVSLLVEALHPLMKNAKRYRAIRVYVADSEQTDAQAFPGGRVVVSTGMLEFAESEAALVGVLAHELAHIDHGHQLEQLRSMLAAQQSFQSGQFSVEDFMASSRLMMNAFVRPFRPEQETVADQDAVRWMMQLGYHPAEFAKLFQRLAKRDGRKAQNVPRFLQSHPVHADRLKAVVAYAQQLAAAARIDLRRLQVGRENLAQRQPLVARQGR